MLYIDNLRAGFTSGIIFNGISFGVNSGEILSIVGPNGSGKTTLLKCITGELKPLSGRITVQNGKKPAILKQEIPSENMKVIEYLLSAFPEIFKLRSEMHEPNPNPSVFDDYFTLGGYDLEIECEKRATELGFEKTDLERELSTFSEGQKQMWSIARLFAQNPDIILMDEPTNHLDISMMVFLENAILNEKENGKAIIVVSHDRTFVDRVSDRTLQIRRGTATMVSGGYSTLIEHVEEDFNTRIKHSEEIKKRVKHLEDEVMRRKSWSNRKEKQKTKTFSKTEGKIDKGYIGARAASLAKKAKNAERRQINEIDKLKEEKPFVEKKINVSFPEYEIVPRVVTSARGISKSYGKNELFEGVDIELSTGDRIALIGENGTGKTTLMGCLTGRLTPDSGEVSVNASAKWLCVPQDVREFFKEKILLDNFNFEGYDESAVRQFLGAMLLRGEKTVQTVDTLSPGELMRSAVVYAILSKSEFLFLDEPTNHLDIESIESLEKLLNEFRGGIFFISHDRTFISNCADDVLILEGKRLSAIEL